MTNKEKMEWLKKIRKAIQEAIDAQITKDNNGRRTYAPCRGMDTIGKCGRMWYCGQCW